MKTLFITLLLSVTVLAGFAQNHHPDKNFIQNISQQEAKTQEKLFKLSNSKVGENNDIYYHRLNLFVNPAVDSIHGSVTTYFTALTPMSTIQFELNVPMVVQSVKYHNVTIATYTHVSNIINITFPSSIPINQKDSITIYYKGAPPQGSGFGSFVCDVTPGGNPIIWTLSEPFGAPDWWPCKNSLKDKIDSVDIFVTTPSQYRVGSNGLLKSESVQGSNKIFHWKTKYPIATYLIAIAVTNYSFYSDYANLHSGTLQILNYVFPESLTTAQVSTPSLIPVMQLYDSLFSDYPYMNEKYGHAQFGWGGGMEHQTMTFLVNFGFDLMAHELAHQWFGDKITCSSWHEIWINESFATYLNGLCYKFLYTNTDWRNWKYNTIYSIIQYPDGSVYCDDTTSVNRIFDGRLSYNKGAMVLNMLRWKIGDSAFFAGMKSYITDSQLAYKFAGTPQFEAHIETASGLNLTEFFTDWIYNQGYPIYTIHSTFNFDKSVNLLISQQPSHTSVSFFPLPIQIKFTNGIKDTTMIFDNSVNNQSFSFNLNFQPTSLVFDPEYELIAVLDTNIITFNVANSKVIPFTISPNPVKDFLTINNNGTFVNDLEIYDLLGHKLMDITVNDRFSRKTLDLTELKSGTYIVKISTADNNFMKKIIKM